VRGAKQNKFTVLHPDPMHVGRIASGLRRGGGLLGNDDLQPIRGTRSLEYMRS
jgi:hypothetical protein